MTPNAFDVEKLLRFFQGLYAHALAMQEVVESTEPIEYEDAKRKYDRQSAEQFELFYRALNDQQAFSKAVKAFLDMHPEPNRRVQ